ncbi:hypothetical protein ACLX1H_001070 [Fusarium chlamydosporum]
MSKGKLDSSLDFSPNSNTNLPVIQPSTEADLFVVVNLLGPTIRPTWSFCIHDHMTQTWKTYSARKESELRHVDVFVCNRYPGLPQIEAQYFKVASISNDVLDKAIEVLRLARPPHAARQLDCSQQYVRSIVSDLVKAGILEDDHADAVFDKIYHLHDQDEEPPHITPRDGTVYI